LLNVLREAAKRQPDQSEFTQLFITENSINFDTEQQELNKLENVMLHAKLKIYAEKRAQKFDQINQLRNQTVKPMLFSYFECAFMLVSAYYKNWAILLRKATDLRDAHKYIIEAILTHRELNRRFDACFDFYSLEQCSDQKKEQMMRITKVFLATKIVGCSHRSATKMAARKADHGTAAGIQVRASISATVAHHASTHDSSSFI